MLDHEIYFDAVRDSLFGGSLEQVHVDGQTVILSVWDYQKASSDLRRLSYMLATAYVETAMRMWPITEYGSQDYLQSKEYYPFIGRGFVQLTWESNYAKASSELSLYDDRDLVAHPELALDSLIATRVMFRGMSEGWFTGRKLSQYFDADTNDPVNARQIINGNDRDEEIAGYHEKFLTALEAAYVPMSAARWPDPEEAPTVSIVTTGTVAVMLNGEQIV